MSVQRRSADFVPVDQHERPAKRARTSDEFDPKRIIKIVLESDESHSPYHLHESHLCDNSRFLQYLLAQSHVKADGPIHLPDVGKQTFEVFSTWIYTKHLEIDELEAAESKASEEFAAIKQEPQDADQQGQQVYPLKMTRSDFLALRRDDRVYARFLDFYSFARLIDSNPFKLAIWTRMQQFYDTRSRPGQGGRLPALSVVKYAVSILTAAALPCKLIAGWYVERGDHEMLDEPALDAMPAEFLATVLRGVFGRLRTASKNKA